MDRLKLKIELVHPNAKLPVKGSANAACWDVYAAEITSLPEGTYIVRLGFKLQPPPGYKVVLIPRSSITNTWLIQQNSPGQGDEDYRGEYQYRFKTLPWYAYHNTLKYYEFPYKVGDRIGQIYLEKVIDFELEEGVVDQTDRGEGGFGSTGK